MVSCLLEHNGDDLCGGRCAIVLEYPSCLGGDSRGTVRRGETDLRVRPAGELQRRERRGEQGGSLGLLVQRGGGTGGPGQSRDVFFLIDDCLAGYTCCFIRNLYIEKCINSMMN